MDEGKYRILLVEDEALSSLRTATMLRARGYSVMEAPSGDAAVGMVADDDGIDLMLMDIALGPGMDGFEAARAILRIRELPVVFLSVHADNEAIAKSIDVGSYGFVPKSEGAGLLDASIRVALRLFEARRDLEAKNRSLAESEERFHRFFELNPDAMLISGLDGKIYDINEGFCSMYGLERKRMVGHFTQDPELSIWKVPEDRIRYIAALKERSEVHGMQFTLKRRDGREMTVLLSGRIMEIEGERRMLSVIHDITEKEAARRAFERLGSIEAVTGKAAKLMLREEAPERVLEGICRIAVEEGGMRMAWVGLAEEGKASIRPVASAGAVDGFFDGLDIEVADTPKGRSPSALAVREGRVAISDDIETDPAMAFWRERALERGFRSMAAFPLRSGGRVIGTYSVYSSEPGAFGAEETRLLEQLSYDVSFTLDRMRMKGEKDEAERLMRESDLRYRESFVQSSAVKLLIDPKSMRITDANLAAARYYGYPLERLRGMSIAEINPAPIGDTAANIELSRRGEKDRFVFKHRLASGELRDVEVFASPIALEGVTFIHSIIHDITEKKKAEEQLEKLVAEKEMLMKELQHRVKNNLGVVSSLLSLAEEKCRDENARAAFAQAIARVESIASIYERLYDSKDLSSIDIGPYAEDLAKSLFATYSIEPGRISLKTSFDGLRLDSKKCVPFGLVLNELLSNALKYAYPESRRGELRVALRSSDGRAELVVEDDGPGMPEEFRAEDTESMGLNLVRLLARQLGGSVSISCDKGTRVSVDFET
jgi:PAS domain S-box-containing protein